MMARRARFLLLIISSALLGARGLAPLRGATSALRASTTFDAAPDRTAAVVGGGPAGALAAIMLARRGWRVDVFDALPAPPAASDPAWGAGERSYQLGINGRGQKALREFGCMSRVDRWSARVNGRLSFAAAGGLRNRARPGRDATAEPSAPFTETRLKPPGTPGAEKAYVTRVMQRDRLQACLLEEVADAHGARVRVAHGVACVGVALAGARPELELRPCAPRGGEAPDECDVAEAGSTAAYDLVVGADGVQSSVRDALIAAPGSKTRAVRFADENERRYKTIPLHPSEVAGTPVDLNWG